MPWKAETLKKLRKRRSMTQEQLARSSGANRVTIAKLETGKLKPGVDMAEKIANALRVSLDEILRDEAIKEAKRTARATKKGKRR